MLALLEDVDFSREGLAWMALGLRALADCDGLHTAEMALIEEFERGLEIDPGNGKDFDSSGECPLTTAREREVFVRSVQLMALADGRISAREQQWLDTVCDDLGISSERQGELAREAKIFLLSSLAGVTAFRAQAEGIGRALGLSSEDIDKALSQQTPGL
ncbi:MAG: hypothetical protein VX498_03345 [Myxococcota bacterium]|nr:hypothetical protein [Myxococcota bacterium]